MRKKRELGGELLLAELPDGTTTKLVLLAEAAAQVAEAIGRNPGAALQAFAAGVDSGELQAFELQPGGNLYAVPVGADRVWRAPVAGLPEEFAYLRAIRTGAVDLRRVRASADPAARFKNMPARAAVEGLAGITGLAVLLREGAADVRGAHRLAPLRLALRADQVAALSAKLTALALAVGATKIVHPVGGDWSRDRGAPWTDAKREAMFRMRHQRGATREEIAAVVGVSGQRVDELIGSKSAIRQANPVWPADWQPSAALILECKALPQPLQAVADTLQGHQSKSRASAR